MRPGQTAPECLRPSDVEDRASRASMRPGQTAPECIQVNATPSNSPSSFNEAGADCPGMPVGLIRQREYPFAASMRPGQTAPECQGGSENG